MVEIRDVADSQSEDLDLGQLLVRGQRWQQLPQLGEGHVKGLDPDALPGGVRRAVLGRGPPPPPLLLAAQRLLGPALGPLLALGRLVGAAARRLEAVEQRLRVGLRPAEVRLRLVRAQHHLDGPLLGLALAAPEDTVNIMTRIIRTRTMMLV